MQAGCSNHVQGGGGGGGGEGGGRKEKGEKRRVREKMIGIKYSIEPCKDQDISISSLSKCPKSPGILYTMSSLTDLLWGE